MEKAELMGRGAKGIEDPFGDQIGPVQHEVNI